jgi:hypothetical protein
MALAALAALMLPPTLTAQALLVDTGQPTGSSFSGPSLFASGSTLCSPQPACQSNFQLLAAQFTLSQAATLDSVRIWIGSFGNAGALDVKIRSDNHGLPGDTQPPYLGPVSIFSKTYTLSAPASGWLTFSNYNAVLAAGTYWLSLEPVAGSNLNLSMPTGAPNPLAKYAFFGNGNPGYLAYLPNPGLGIQVYGTNFPGYAFGTATRTILTVSPVNDQIRGAEGQALTSSWFIDTNGAGSSFALGRLIENGLSAGAYSGTCWSIYATCSTGAGRGVAYRTFVNTGSVAKTFRINAILEGAFYGSGTARATGGIYVFNPTGFTNTLNASGVGAAEYLMRRDSLVDLGTASASLSLATLFPGSVLTTAFVAPVSPLGQFQTTPIATGLITLGPNETFTVMFDVTAYSSNGGSSSFADTLGAGPNFFTDANGAVVTEIVAVGPSDVNTPPATSIALTPASATNPVGATHTVTATVTSATGSPVPNANVYFTITEGPNAGQPGPIGTDANGQAKFSYSSTVAGTDKIQANIKTLQSNVVQAIWQLGAPDHITIAPLNATIVAGGSQPYTAQAFDALNNSLGDVTSSTTFGITPDGSCTAASCTANIAGPHTVTATYNGKTATAALTVNAGALHHITIAPPSATITAGASQPFTSQAFDSFNNSLGNVTGSTTFSITPDGSCTGASCTANLAGPHTVTATYSGKTATATLTVTAGPLDHITIAPPSATIAVGASQPFTTQAFDSFNNSLGNVTGAATFGITPDGSCTGASCTATIPGPHTVTTTYIGKTATATLTVNGSNACVITVKPATLKQPYVAVPYLEILSAQPAGSYTFSVSSGALPPGLKLVSAVGVSSIAGLPTTPGAYSFTIKVKKSNASCEQTIPYSLTVPATIVPLLQCVDRNSNGGYLARFGYDNTTGGAVTIPVGSANYFTPGSQNRGQPTVFQPGHVNNAFSVTLNANGSNLAIWLLRGPDGVLRPLNVTTATLGCK